MSEQINRRIVLLELLSEANIDCVVALDTDLKVVFWNRMAENVTSKSKSEVLGRDVRIVFPIFEADEALKNGLENAINGWQFFEPLTHTAFLGPYIECHFIPLKDSAGTVGGIMIIGHDISHRIKAEQQLQQLNIELKQLNSALLRKNRELQRRNNELISFTYAASHDLKEPLRKISIFSGLILGEENENLSERGKSLYNRILGAIRRMEMLTDDIVKLSNINLVGEPAMDVSLDQVLHLALKNLQQKIATSDAKVRSVRLPVIVGQPGLLSQLLFHLIDNALKFQPVERKPNVGISCKTVLGCEIDHPDAIPEVSYYCIGIHDNGIGFKDEHGSQIFELFRRLHSIESYHGNGIGLSLCQKIMEMHSGFITASGTPGHGSVFTCYFPIYN